MYIRFDHLIEGLSHRLSVRIPSIPSGKIVTGIRLLTEPFHHQKAPLDMNAVYVAESRVLKTYTELQEFPPVICVAEYGSTGNLFRGWDVAVVYGSTMLEVMAALAEELHYHGQKSSELTEYTHGLLTAGTMDELLEAAFPYVKNPLVVTDGNQKIVAYTNPALITSPRYRALIDLEYLPAGHGDSSSHQPQDVSGSYFVIEPQTENSPGLICRALVIKAKVVGYLHMLDFAQNFCRETADMLDLLGNLLTVELWNQLSLQPMDTETALANFYRELLDETIGDTQKILQRQQLIDREWKEFYYVVHMQIDETATGKRLSLYQLAKMISGNLPDSFGFLYQNYGVVVINTAHEILDLRSYFLTVQEILEKHQLILGVSNGFRGLWQLPGYGQQAKKAMELGRKSKPEAMIHLYQDYSLYYMMELCSGNQALDSFCAPELLRFIDYCQENGSELLETLRVYLQCGRSKSQTAREMYVHLNTIKYRMNQIQAILGLDLNQDDNALKLLLSFKMLEYQNMTKE